MLVSLVSRSAVEAILQSPAWYKALYFEQMYSHGKPRDTPLRKLITHMPGNTVDLVILAMF